MCGQQFELRIDEHVFIGHPTALGTHVYGKAETSTVYNVVIILRKGVTREGIKSYHKLAQQFATALEHEEARCGHLMREMRIMMSKLENQKMVVDMESPDHVMSQIMSKSTLARNLSSAFIDLKGSGVVQVRVNNWITISFCVCASEHPCLEPVAVKKRAQPQTIRPYHTLILRSEGTGLLQQLPLDCSSALYRLAQSVNLHKTFEELAVDINVTVTQVLRLALHLTSWHEAMIIHPLCATNVYIVARVNHTF